MRFDNPLYMQISRAWRKWRYVPAIQPHPSTDSVPVYWWNGRVNLGDCLNKKLVEILSNEPTTWVPINYAYEHYFASGSILGRANDQTIVWGSGLISPNDIPIFSPKSILAVRGPLTREALLSNSIECPDIYGDPALLLPHIYKASKDKKYALGIIPHYVDKNLWLQSQTRDDVQVIDIETDDIQSFVEQVTSCEVIVSSSLHGIIISDAYGVPAYKANFGGRLTGGTFKFKDYELSVSRQPTPIINLQSQADVIKALTFEKSIELDINIQRLMDVCPFKSIEL